MNQENDDIGIIKMCLIWSWVRLAISGALCIVLTLLGWSMAIFLFPIGIVPGMGLLTFAWLAFRSSAKAAESIKLFKLALIEMGEQ